MTDLSDKILNKIEEERIEPAPKWNFLLKDYVLWSLFVFCAVLGSFAFAVMLYAFSQSDFAILKKINAFNVWISALPYFWIAFLLLFLGAAYYNFQHTKRGYKYSPVMIVLGSIIVSLALGALMHNAGAGEKVDKLFEANIPNYPTCEMRRRQIWMHPQDGLLGGEIIDYKNMEDFVLKDFDDKAWNVKAARAIIAPMAAGEMRPGGRIKMIGKASNSDFIAAEIKEWKCSCGQSACNMIVK